VVEMGVDCGMEVATPLGGTRVECGMGANTQVDTLLKTKVVGVGGT